ncbi:MAG: hypothetical protein ACI8UR_002266 [Natronomonas sp.]|jgi:hypothetical protein|uniref:hypothetical protein n=1 Tax=Natronomonas sp. TaxID=2184060 RepID=UPI003989F0F5
MNVSRRQVLGGVGAAAASALAGCGNRGPGRTSFAVFVTNATETEHRVTLRLYRLPGEAASNETAREDDTSTDDLEQVYVRRETLAPEGDFSVPGEELPAGDLRVRLVTADGPVGTYDWRRVDERSTVDIRIEASSVRFTELD